MLSCVDVGDLFCYREFRCDGGSCAVLCCGFPHRPRLCHPLHAGQEERHHVSYFSLMLYTPHVFFLPWHQCVCVCMCV